MQRRGTRFPGRLGCPGLVLWGAFPSRRLFTSSTSVWQSQRAPGGAWPPAFPPPVTRFLARAFGPSAAGPAGGRPLVTSSTLPGTSQPLAPSPLRFCALRYYFSQPRPHAAPEKTGCWRGGGWAGTHPPARSTSHRLAGARPRDPTSRRAGFVAPALAAARREGRVSHLGLAGPCLRGSGRGRERPPCGSALTPRRRAQPERAQGCPPSPAPPLPRSMAGRLPACVVDCGTG